MEQFFGEATSNFVLRGKKFIVHFRPSSAEAINGQTSIPFGWFWLEDKRNHDIYLKDFYIGKKNSIHPMIERKLEAEWVKRTGKKNGNIHDYVSLHYSLRGRVFLRESAISFSPNKDDTPSPAELKDTIERLNENLNIDLSDFKLYLNNSLDYRSKDTGINCINEYTVMEYITGIDPNEKEIDVEERRQNEQSRYEERIGMEKYHDALKNDPWMDKRYRNLF